MKGRKVSTAIADPFDTATSLGDRKTMFFGKLEVNARFINMEAGKKKEAWFEGMNIENRRTEIELRLNPIDAMNVTFLVTRTLIAEFSDWSGIVWPSMKLLGLKSVREAHGRWAQVEMVNGRTYKKNGEDVTPTQMKFIAFYDNAADCTAAYDKLMGASAVTTPTPAPTVSQDNTAELATAMQFLPAVVKAANGDLNKLALDIANMPLLKKFFTVNSPEVQALLKAA